MPKGEQRRGRRLVALVRAVFAGLVALVCFATVAATELPEALPEEVGIDAAQLVELSRVLREKRLDVRSFLVVRDGKLVFERYSAGVTREHNHAIYSVSKSVSSTLIGILVKQGKISSADVPIVGLLPKVEGIPEENLAARADLKLKHVLWMASGTKWVEHPTNTPIYRAPNRLAVALEPPMAHPPGKVFNYSNADAELIGAVIQEQGGPDALKFAEKHLFAPLGMKNYDWWYPDRTGRYPGGWAMRLRAIDMAKLGLLYLQGGRWDGTPILDSSWIDSATTGGTVPYYGYFWWLGTVLKDASVREYAARGWKGQFIVVLPDLDMVVTMTSILADDREEAVMRSALVNYILPATRRGKKPRTVTPEKTAALEAELAEAARTRGKPGQSLNEQDRPQR